MKLKALSLGAALGFLIASIPSCGTTASNCGPNNCTGCCSNGMCVSALTDSACGSSGNACTNCTMAGQTCNTATKSCIGAMGGGTATGGGTGMGGGSAMGGGSVTGGGSAMGGGSAVLIDCQEGSMTCPAGTVCVIEGINSNAGKCRPGYCSMVLQNCPSMQKCAIGGFDDGGFGPQCVRYTLGDGGVPDEAACAPGMFNNPDPCLPGAQCVQAQGAASGFCSRFCEEVNQVRVGCPATAACVSGVSFTGPGGVRIPGAARLCQAILQCDPFNQASCADAGINNSCRIVPVSDTMAAPLCVPGGTVPVGMPCGTEMTGQCVPGSQCITPPDGGSVCQTFCNLDGGMPGCTASMCRPFGIMNVGSCTP